jgi:hypothetical protein
MTPRNHFRNQLDLYRLAVGVIYVVTAVGGYYWIDPDQLEPQEREFWFLTYKGATMLVVWVAAFIAYCVAIIRLRCPRCHTRLRIFRDLSGLAYWAWGRDVKKPCPNCGLNFDKEWPPLTTVEEALAGGDEWENKNSIK